MEPWGWENSSSFSGRETGTCIDPQAVSQRTASPTRPVSPDFLTLTLLLFFSLRLKPSSVDGFSSQAYGGPITQQGPHTFQAPKSRATGLEQEREVLWCWGQRDLGDSRLLLTPSCPVQRPCHSALCRLVPWLGCYILAFGEGWSFNLSANPSVRLGCEVQTTPPAKLSHP